MDPDHQFEGLVPVGYWQDFERPDLPDPGQAIDPSWDQDVRARVVAALGSAVETSAGAGCSICRICGVPNGFIDLTDGIYVWPEGLAHYVAEHDVRLPDSVVDHLLSPTAPSPRPLTTPG